MHWSGDLGEWDLYDADLKELSMLIGHKFSDTTLLRTALRDPGYAINPASMTKLVNFERLEFVGDRVLSLVVAEMLFERFPDDHEGALATRHSALVCKANLIRIAESIRLMDFMVLMRGEMGRDIPGIMADGCEAVIGAVYRDAGLKPAEALVRRLWAPLLDEVEVPAKEPKITLQAWAQGQGKGIPVYETISCTGTNHAPVHSVQITVKGMKPLIGTGQSKKLAQQDAASKMLLVIEEMASKASKGKSPSSSRSS